MIAVVVSSHRVSIFTAGGELLARWGAAGNALGQFASFLYGICIDSYGDLYAADERRMQKFERFDPKGPAAHVT